MPLEATRRLQGAVLPPLAKPVTGPHADVESRSWSRASCHGPGPRATRRDGPGNTLGGDLVTLLEYRRVDIPVTRRCPFSESEFQTALLRRGRGRRGTGRTSRPRRAPAGVGPASRRKVGHCQPQSLPKSGTAGHHWPSPCPTRTSQADSESNRSTPLARAAGSEAESAAATALRLCDSSLSSNERKSQAASDHRA